MAKAIFTTGTLSGKRIRLTTNTAADPRERYRVLSLGANTGFFISVPYSLMAYGTSSIEIGSRKLRIDHRQKTVDGFIPDSWLVDLSADVEELQEAA